MVIRKGWRYEHVLEQGGNEWNNGAIKLSINHSGPEAEGGMVNAFSLCEEHYHLHGLPRPL